MKKFIKKAISSALCASMLVGVSGAAAYAVDSTTAQKQAFVQSYANDEELYTVAQMYMENNLSLSTMQNLMADYINGRSRYEATPLLASTESNPSFYSGTNISSKPHHGVVIETNSSSYIATDTTICYQNDYIHIPYNETNNSVAHTTYIPVLGEFCEIENDDSTGSIIRSLKWKGMIQPIYSGNNAPPIALFSFNFELKRSVSSEANLYNLFSISYKNIDFNNNSTTLKFNTYVSGDVNRDGIVNSTDSYLIQRYLANLNNNFPDAYSDEGPEIAQIVNKLAADADNDGEISINDVTCINSNHD